MPSGLVEDDDAVGARFDGPRDFRARPGAASGPPAGDLVLLADTGLVLKPDLYVLALRLLGGDLRQLGGEVFLNAAMAS